MTLRLDLVAVEVLIVAARDDVEASAGVRRARRCTSCFAMSVASRAEMTRRF